jgi:hypothetical protein
MNMFRGKMKEPVFLIAFIALAILVPQFSGLASETVIAGNYSFTFNMTVPHQIQYLDPSKYAANVIIKTFDGRLVFMDWGAAKDKRLEWWGRKDQTTKYLGTISKNISGDGNEDGDVYVFSDTRFEMVFKEFDIQSSLNLTQSIDFFRDVKIAWHEKSWT